MANIPQNQIDAAARRAALSSDVLLEKKPLDYAPEKSKTTDQNKLAKRASFLGAGGIKPSRSELERIIGDNDLVDEFFFERALRVGQSVCRIVLRNSSDHVRGYATGFMISPRLLLTNHHVFPTADEVNQSLAEFNYRLNIYGSPEKSYRFQVRPDQYFFNNENLDFAIVSVDPFSLEENRLLSDFGFHRLIPISGKTLEKEWLSIAQHPSGAPRQWAIRENQCIADKDPDVIWYVSDTAPGSSGAIVTNDSFQAVALHHSGVAKRDASGKYELKNGELVNDLKNVDDDQVVWIANAGIRISRICQCIAEIAPENGDHLAELWRVMQDNKPAWDASAEGNLSTQSIEDTAMQNTQDSSNRIVLGSLVLELNAGLGLPSSVVSGPTSGSTIESSSPVRGKTAGGEEAFKEPWVDTDYTSRTGFDEGFLGVNTPLPELIDASLAAPLLDNSGYMIPYEHFSVCLHKLRKLAIFTASNVDGSNKAKRPDSEHSYTRKALTGLGDNDQEKWLIDPRVDASCQIGDKFYTKDNGAFDKGHIVRREDVCWGKDYGEVRRANGDTFHVTNCSPQRGNFNQSGKSGIWGQLENYVAMQAKAERYCIFAGPILDANDGLFKGTENVRIPSRFWKVICAVTDGELQVFAFLLEQDVTDLPLEFQVEAEWKAKQVHLSELEQIISLIRFADVYHQADQK